MDTFLVISKEFLSCFIDPLFVYQTSLGALSKQHLGSNAAHLLPNSLEERRTCRQIKQNKTKQKKNHLNNTITIKQRNQQTGGYLLSTKKERKKKKKKKKERKKERKKEKKKERDLHANKKRCH